MNYFIAFPLQFFWQEFSIGNKNIINVFVHSGMHRKYIFLLPPKGAGPMKDSTRGGPEPRDFPGGPGLYVKENSYQVRF